MRFRNGPIECRCSCRKSQCTSFSRADMCNPKDPGHESLRDSQGRICYHNGVRKAQPARRARNVAKESAPKLDQCSLCKSCRSHTRGVLCCTFLYQSPTGQERRGISFGCLTSACCLPVCVGLACTLGLARRLRVTGGRKMMRKVAPLKDLPAVLTCHGL